MLNKIYLFFRKFITKNNEHGQPSGGLWPRLIRGSAADLLKNFSGSIIELGCGEGLFLEKIAKNNPNAKITGIDFCKDILTSAFIKTKDFNNIELIHSDALSSKLENEKFDYVFCLNTIINLKSLDDIKILFTEARRILKPDGYFIFDIRNALNPLIKLQYKFVRFYDTGCTVSVKAYRTKQIESILKEHKFNIEKKINIGFPNNCFAPAIMIKAKKI